MLIGHNWWCSLFPALCFTDVSNGVINSDTEKLLKESLNNEEFELLTNKSQKMMIKFKIIELFN